MIKHSIINHWIMNTEKLNSFVTANSDCGWGNYKAKNRKEEKTLIKNMLLVMKNITNESFKYY